MVISANNWCPTQRTRKRGMTSRTFDVTQLMLDLIDNGWINRVHEAIPDTPRRITGDEQDRDTDQQPNNRIEDRQSDERSACREQHRQRGQTVNASVQPVSDHRI